MSEWLLAACISGVVTLHGVMPAVLAAHPDRACADCDGYLAPVDCAAIGDRYVLYVNGKALVVEAADCVTFSPPSLAAWPRKRGALWLGDVDARLWSEAGLPLAPYPAMLCPFEIGQSLPFDWRLWQ